MHRCWDKIYQTLWHLCKRLDKFIKLFGFYPNRPKPKKVSAGHFWVWGDILSYFWKWNQIPILIHIIYIILIFSPDPQSHYSGNHSLLGDILKVKNEQFTPSDADQMISGAFQRLKPAGRLYPWWVSQGASVQQWQIWSFFPWWFGHLFLTLSPSPEKTRRNWRPRTKGSSRGQVKTLSSWSFFRTHYPMLFTVRNAFSFRACL